MAREIIEKEILGFTYRIEKLGALVGKKVLTRLVRAVGPAFAFEDAEGGVAKTLEALARNLSEELVDYLCDLFAGKTRFCATDKPEAEWSLKDKFDEHFAGRYGAMTLWLKECLVINYESFFLELGGPDGLQGLLSMAGTKATNPSMRSGESS